VAVLHTRLERVWIVDVGRIDHDGGDVQYPCATERSSLPGEGDPASIGRQVNAEDRPCVVTESTTLHQPVRHPSRPLALLCSSLRLARQVVAEALSHNVLRANDLHLGF